MAPDEFAVMWQVGLRLDDLSRERSQQTHVGVSDIGVCRERTRLTVTQAEPTDSTDGAAAYIGTAIHKTTLEAFHDAYPHTLIEQAYVTTLPSGRTVPGHADLIDPCENSVTDLKTVDGIAYVRKHGPTEQQRIQRTLYALGAWQAGVFGDTPLEAVTCRNIWLDRSGGTSDVHVDQELFDSRWVEAADEWLHDVVYAVEHGEVASKDKPIPWCRSFCPFFSTCRGEDVQPEDVITDPEVVQAARTYRDALDMEKQAAQLKKEAKSRLDGHNGQAGDLRVRWVYTNGSRVEFDRAPSWRLEVQPLLRKKP